MNDFNFDNEIIEVSDEVGENTSTLEDLIKEEVSKSKSPKERKKLTKKQKTIIIVVSCVLLVLLVVGIILYFVFFKDEEEKPKEPEETVILEKDNYRYENGKLVFLDKNEKEIGTYECINKDTTKCYVAKINYENDTFDRVKSVYEDGQEIEKNSSIYYDKYVFVYDDDKIFLYNMEDTESELNLQNIKSYSTKENLVVIEDEDSKYGLIEIKEDGYEYLIRPSYDNLGIVNPEENLVLAQDKDDYYIINSEGKKLSDDISANVKGANKDFIVAEKNDTYNLYSYENEELLSDYDYISLHDGVIALVQNKRLYLVDNELNKLNEDGIRLENNDYVKQYVYNENNRLVETLKSYEISVDNDIASIEIDGDTKTINVLEGSLSSTLGYLSYLDGKLYFYGDEEKTDLLGTYSCKNVNVINSKEDTLNNCNVYTSAKGVSGIYNNELVIVYDNESSENKLYYLYNIKEKKVKGTYSYIEILNENELKEQFEPLYTSSSYIIAKTETGSNKGNFGVVEINSEKVQGKVAFNYESITLEKDYYKLLSKDKTYSLYDKEFTKISNEFSDIKLFDKYYVGINNNKLNVYSYDNTLGILESDLQVTNNDYEIDFNNGFVITINNEVYKYDKNGKVIKDSIVDAPVIDSNEDNDSSNTENNNESNEDSNEGVGNGE